MRTIDNQIVEAAVKRYGCQRAEVLRVIQRSGLALPEDPLSPWFWLFVDGEAVGRRRTKLELLSLVENRMCPRSARPVGAIPGASWGPDFE